MATTTHRVNTPSTSNATSYVSAAFTPAAGELLVIGVMAGATAVAAPTLVSSTGITFTLVDVVEIAGSTDRLYLFVADAVATAVSMTLTFDCTGDAADGAVIMGGAVGSYGGRVGLAAIRQSIKAQNQAAGTPALTFPAAVLTTNPTFGFVGNASNPANVTAPTGHTTLANGGYSTPTTGEAYVARLSGFTGPTLTWAGASASAFGAIAVEIDITSPAADGTLDIVLPALGVDIAGELVADGALDIVLPALDATFAGEVLTPVEGTLDIILPALSATFAGDAIAAGTADIILPALDATFAGDAIAAGTVDVTLPALDATFAGEVEAPVEGTLDVTLPALEALFAGTVEGVDLMTLLGEAAEWIRDQIKATGARAVLDLEDVNPPCVLVVLDTAEHRFLASEPYYAQWHLFLVVQKQRMVDTYNALDELHGQVRSEFQSSTPVEFAPLQLKGGGDPSPALHMTVRVRVT
jgi:hypothetical protein